CLCRADLLDRGGAGALAGLRRSETGLSFCPPRESGGSMDHRQTMDPRFRGDDKREGLRTRPLRPLPLLRLNERSRPDQSSDFLSGRFLRSVSASSSSSLSLIESYMPFDAPLSSETLVSPRLAERA